MDFDPLTEGFPTRTAQEEEEEDAEPHADENFDDALCCWTPAAKASMSDGMLRPSLLVVAIGAAPCAIFHHCLGSSKSVMGTIALAEVSMSGNSLDPSLADRSCYVYSAGGSPGTLVVLCQYEVKPERAHTWVSGLLGSIAADRTVIFSSALAGEVQAAGPGGAETPVFLLQTAAWRGADAAEGPRLIPTLPSGNIIGGVAAKLLSTCQMQGKKGCLLVLRQQMPTPDSLSVRTLAEAAKALLEKYSTGSSVGLGLDNQAAVKCACEAVEVAHWDRGLSGHVYM